MKTSNCRARQIEALKAHGSSSPTKSTRCARMLLNLSSHATTQWRALSEARRTLQEQLDAAEKRIMQLEDELAAAREKLTLLDDDKRSLQIAVDQALNQTARLTRRLTESENTLTATRAQLSKVEASFAEVYAGRGRFGTALDEAKEQHQAERNSLNMRLGAFQSRAATSDLNGCCRKHGKISSSVLKKCAPSTANRSKQQLRVTTPRSVLCRSRPSMKRANARSKITNRRGQHWPNATTR